MGRKWMNIREKKAKQDTNTSRIYAKFGVEIYAAAKSGEPDPELNQKLKFVIDRAKTYNVPNSIIDRAIDKAKGNDDEKYQELHYEGFGPNGSLIMVYCLSNNVNRTAADVRAAFSKNGGNMGVTGSVNYQFTNTAVFVVEGEDEEEMMMALLEAGADVRDVFQEDDHIVIYGEPTEFQVIKEALEALEITDFQVAEIEMLPNSEVTLEGDDLNQFLKLIDTLEDNEDVQKVFHNVDLDEE